jgi:TorA maturation chaperone TorD
MQTDPEYDWNSILKGYNLLLYFAGSMIMYEPTEECVTDFWKNGILKNLPVTSSNPRFVEAASQLRYSCENPNMCLPLLRDDFERLFSDKGKLLAPPLKSYFKERLQTEASRKETTRDFYNTYGWKFRSRYNIGDDHLGIELIFLTLLTDKLAGFDDELCVREMRNEIRRFISSQILSWLPEWNKLVQKNSETHCYKGIANMIFAVCEDIYNLLGASDTKPEFTASLKN